MLKVHVHVRIGTRQAERQERKEKDSAEIRNSGSQEKKNGLGIAAEGRYPGPSGLVIRRPMQQRA